MTGACETSCGMKWKENDTWIFRVKSRVLTLVFSYNVDFEDYSLLSDSDAVSEDMWDDGCYRAWAFAEEYRRRPE